MPLQNYRTLVATKIQDTAEKLQPDQIDELISEAVGLYSADNPLHKIHVLTGDGVTVTFAVPSDWEDGFSWIEQIEHPVGRQEPEYLDDDDVIEYRDPTTSLPKIRFVTMTLANAATAAVEYVVRHTVTTSTDTIPTADRPAVANLAASLCCQVLAVYYTQTSDSTIGADAVSYATKGDEYQKRAEMYRAAYNAQMGVTEDGVLPASAIQDLDVDLQNLMGDRFWHGRRYR